MLRCDGILVGRRSRPMTSLGALAVAGLVVTACGLDDDDTATTETEAEQGEAAPGTADEHDDEGEQDGEDGADDGDGAEDDAPDAPPFERLDEVMAETFADPAEEGLDRWQDEVPAIEDVVIPSSLDDHEQAALWLAPDGDGPRPLLVVLHTWSTPYLQHQGIPFARWAERTGWAMLHPNFRGANEGPEQTGSEEAVQDIVDAVDWAIDEADIAEDHVFVAGFSGGGMMALNVAGQHPERFAAVVSWAPNYDLVDWYEYSLETAPEADYLDQMEAACGGDPTADQGAAEECDQRSPVTHIDGIADADLPVYLGHGLQDDIVPPDHSVRAFDDLVGDDDGLGDEAVDAARSFTLPDGLDGEVEADTYFTDEEPEVRFARSAGPVTLVLFDSEHDMAYNPGLEWLVTEVMGGG